MDHAITYTQYTVFFSLLQYSRRDRSETTVEEKRKVLQPPKTLKYRIIIVSLPCNILQWKLQL